MKKKKVNEPQINYLDLIPEKNDSLEWYKDYNGKIVLKVENTGFFNKVAQNLFNKPRYTKVHLDVQGSYIWPFIDGEKTVMELAQIQKEHFGDAVEPLYPRIIKYFQIVESYHFIKFKNLPEK